MISYATDGGGVGPHVDRYDVFLIQAQGRRRWRIGKPLDDECFLPGVELPVLAGFECDRESVLEPGDLLYLPPGIAHEGVAVGGECVTCSVGFRVPDVEVIADRVARETEERPRVVDDPDHGARPLPKRRPSGGGAAGGGRHSLPCHAVDLPRAAGGAIHRI